MGVLRLQEMVEMPGDVLDRECVGAGGVEALVRFLDPDSSEEPTLMSSSDADGLVKDGTGVHTLVAVGATNAVAEVGALYLVQKVVEVFFGLVGIEPLFQCE